MPRKKDEPPYLKYALLNPYNLSLLAGAGVASAATGHWWVGVSALVAETVWLLFAPDSKALRHGWFDKIWDGERKSRVADVRAEKYRGLQFSDQQRSQVFWESLRRIEQLAKDNPSMTAELVRAEIAKLDDLYDDFIDLALMAGRGETHLARVNYGELNTSWRQYEQQIKQLPQGDRRRSIAEKNLEVLAERKKRMEELATTIQSARGQMDLLDNTVRLLGDEIMAMTTPAQLGLRLDELRTGVSTLRETAKDVDDVYAAMEDEMAADETRAAR